MANGPATANPPRTAAEIAREVALGRRSRSLLAPDLRPGQYLGRLVQGRHHADAVRFMAHSLLNREAVWWASLCVRYSLRDDAPREHRLALGAAVRWAIDPSEANRREAGASAMAARRTAAGSVARAALYAAAPAPTPGPSPAPSPTPAPGPVLPILTAKLCAAGVLMAATRGRPAEASLNLRQFLALGLDVAYGTNRWE